MLIIIAAIDEGNAIGNKGKLLCNLPDDLAHFKQKTLGHKVLFGRKTVQQMSIWPLPFRENWVLTKQWNRKDAINDYKLPIQWAKTEDVYICGGEQIYRLYLPYAEKMYLTQIHHRFEIVDAYFPTINKNEWMRIEAIEHPIDKLHPYAFTMVEYIRRN